MKFSVIVAADADRGIGKGGDLPWRLPGETTHFVRTTRGERDANAVIMGRKTWESVPEKYRPLEGRLNVVLTRQPEYVVPEGVLVAPGLEAALELATLRAEQTFVVGGGAIYDQALSLPGCETVYYTRLDRSFDCDVFFPELEPRFERAEILSEAEEKGIAYRIELWRLNAS